MRNSKEVSNNCGCVNVKNIIILGALSVALFLLVFVLYEKLKLGKEAESLTEAQIQEQTDSIIAEKNFEKCGQIKNDLYKTVCVNNIALNLARETNDISYCRKIDDKLISVKECEAAVLLPKSLTRRDVNICGETSDSSLREECEANFWPNLAVWHGSQELCGNASVQEDEDNCRDNYLMQKEAAADMVNFSCGRFQNSQTKKDCELYKADINAITSQTCLEMESEVFSNFCFISVLTKRPR